MSDYGPRNRPTVCARQAGTSSPPPPAGGKYIVTTSGCNDCHTPHHNIVAKYTVKAINGFNHSLHFSFVLEMLFLTFAMGDRIRILKAMRDRALKRIIHQHEVNMQLKDRVNRELEQKVLERTQELNTKNEELEKINHKLEQQSSEINQINSMLDLDNWKLKNSIREVLNERPAPGLKLAPSRSRANS